MPPYHQNVGKRLVKSPKVYIRDTGILHALLSLKTKENILGHPIIGQSWEGFVIETLLGIIPQGVEGSFYRTSGGTEVDLVLTFPDGRVWLIEIKRTLAPKVEQGFYQVCRDLNAEKSFIVYSGQERFPLTPDIEAISLPDLSQLLLHFSDMN